MEYLLIDGKDEKWTLGKVTARREKALSELGLVRANFGSEKKEEDVTEIVKQILDECGDRLIKLVKVLFEGRELEKGELEDVDKIEVQKGIMGFFLRDLELITEYSNFLTTLDLQKSTEKKPETSKG